MHKCHYFFTFNTHEATCVRCYVELFLRRGNYENHVWVFFGAQSKPLFQAYSLNNFATYHFSWTCSLIVSSWSVYYIQELSALSVLCDNLIISCAGAYDERTYYIFFF